MIAKPEFSYYVPENFSAEDLANKVVEILSLSDEDFQAKSSLAVDFASSELSIDKMSDYYLELYNSLDRKNNNRMI